jgi:hypothetical protein
MLGAARQCVFASASRQRRQELTLLACSILAYTVTIQPARSTGFCLRRVRAQVHFQDLPELGQLRRKK